MNLLIYSLFAVPLWCAMFALYFLLRKHGLARVSLIAKWAGTFLAAGSVLFGLVSRSNWEQSPENLVRILLSPVLWFALLCGLADVVLEIKFIPGMALFAAAHCCLIVMLFPAASKKWGLLVWVLAMLAAVIVFRKELPKMGRLALPACLYVAVLSCTLALALPGPFLWWNSQTLAFRGARICLAAGALCFYISDLMVAKQEFGQMDRRKRDGLQKPVMLLYWLALYLISASVWL